jgi:hypothetical protein
VLQRPIPQRARLLPVYMGVTVMKLGNTSGAIPSGVPGCSAYQTVRARSFVITAALIVAVKIELEP